MGFLPTEEVDGDIFGKWEQMAECYNVEDQDGPLSLSLASQVNPTTSTSYVFDLISPLSQIIICKLLVATWLSPSPTQ